MDCYEDSATDFTSFSWNGIGSEDCYLEVLYFLMGTAYCDFLVHRKATTSDISRMAEP